MINTRIYLEHGIVETSSVVVKTIVDEHGRLNDLFLEGSGGGAVIEFIDLNAIKAVVSLNKRGFEIDPNKLRRRTGSNAVCPKCGFTNWHVVARQDAYLLRCVNGHEWSGDQTDVWARFLDDAHG